MVAICAHSRQIGVRAAQLLSSSYGNKIRTCSRRWPMDMVGINLAVGQRPESLSFLFSA